MTECLDDTTLQDFVDGRLDDATRARAFEHIGGCELCRALVAEAMHGAGHATTDDTLAADGADNRLLVAGERVGRYVVIGLVGAGGMGVVYSAYDPELDRKVALKLLRRAADGSDASEGLERRLRREAQSMARLTHPNIVTVHDVGSFDGRLFIAMEFVSGRTFGEWLREEKRSWRDVRAVLLAAGRGLAAAHAAGIVHRDFKPDNVLVSQDGRVLVTDFGLARTFDASMEGTVELTAEEPGDAMETRTKGLIGTPAYMAPEQVVGRALDSRTDIYAFCVTAFEAFVGRRPFRAETLPQLRDAILTGRVQDEPGDRPVPRWLRRAIAKGMEKEPAARFRSMAELLTQLARDPARTLTRALAVSAVVLLVAGGFVLNESLRGAPERRCSGARTRLSGVWSTGQRDALTAAFDGVKAPWAKETAGRVVATLDGYGEQWTKAHTEACLATRVRAEQSETILERRMACLESRRAELGALVSLLTSGDLKVLQEAPRAAARLSSLDGCSDVAALTDEPALPLGEEPSREAEALRRELAEARAQLALGQYTQVAPRFAALLARTRALAYPPLVAEAALLHARALDGAGRVVDAEAPYREAIDAAFAGRRDRILFEAMSYLARLMSSALRRNHEAPLLLRLADALVARAGSPPLWQARAVANKVLYLKEAKDFARATALAHEGLQLLARAGLNESLEASLIATDLASTYHEGGETQRATPFLERSLQIDTRLFGEHHPNVGLAHTNLGMTYFMSYDFGRAVRHYSRGLAIRESTLGRDAPALFRDYNMLGILRMYLGDHPRARADLQRALVLIEKAHGPEYHRIAMPLSNLGLLEARDGRFELARQHAERAAALVAKHFGADHVEQAAPWELIALVALRAGRCEEARSKAADTTALRARSLGLAHPDLALTMDIEAYALLCLGRAEEARKLAERSRALREKAPGPEHPDYADSLTYLALAELDLGRHEEARTHLRAARKLHEARGGEMTITAFRKLAEARAALLSAQVTQETLATLESAIATLGKLPGYRRELEVAKALLPKVRAAQKTRNKP